MVSFPAPFSTEAMRRRYSSGSVFTILASVARKMVSSPVVVGGDHPKLNHRAGWKAFASEGVRWGGSRHAADATGDSLDHSTHKDLAGLPSHGYCC